MGGDFNEIFYASESGSVRSNSQMLAFSEAINSCRLSDLLAKGDQFTWCNRRKNDEIIFERLEYWTDFYATFSGFIFIHWLK